MTNWHSGPAPSWHSGPAPSWHSGPAPSHENRRPDPVPVPSHHDEDARLYTDYEWHSADVPPMSHEQETLLWNHACERAAVIGQWIDGLRNSTYRLGRGDTMGVDDSFHEIVRDLDTIGEIAHQIAHELEHKVHDLANNPRFLALHQWLLLMIEPLRIYASHTFANLEQLWFGSDRKADGVQKWVEEFINEVTSAWPR
jgi:hypothetical protein